MSGRGFYAAAATRVARDYSASCCGSVRSSSTRRANAAAKSRKAVAGSMIVSRRPPTSSVIFRNRPRWFSLRSRKKIFRSITTFSDASGSMPVLSPGFELIINYVLSTTLPSGFSLIPILNRTLIARDSRLNLRKNFRRIHSPAFGLSLWNGGLDAKKTGMGQTFFSHPGNPMALRTLRTVSPARALARSAP